MNVLKLVPIENSARAKSSPPEFAEFWATWPRRVGKRDAEKAWAKLRPQDKVAAMEALVKHLAYWEACATERQFIPHPASWLNGARWEDEIEMPRPKNVQVHQGQAAAAPGWMASWAGLDGKARELRIDGARLGETHHAYKARILQAIDDRDRLRKVG